MKAMPLNKQNFRAWGKFIAATEKENCQAYEGFNYVGNVAVADISGPLSFSILEPLKRDFVLTQLEQHRISPEMCTALKNDCLLFVAKDKNNAPDFDSVQAFILKSGDTVIYDPGVWHGVPFPVANESCTQLIVYKDQTGANDFYAFSLNSPIHAEL